MLAFFCAFHLSCSPSVPTSPVPDKNASLCTQGPVLCLKSHLQLCSPDTVLPFLRLLRRPDGLICQPRSSPPPAAAARATDACIVLPFLVLTRLHPAWSHLPPAQDAGSRDLSREAFIHPSPLAPFRASQPGTLSLRNGLCRGPGAVRDTGLLL